MGANAQTTVPTFTAGQVLTAAQMNDSARTGVPVFADTTARDAGFGGTGEKTLAEGQLAYIENLTGVAQIQYYDGSAWVSLVASGVVQVKSTSKSDTFTTSSTSFVDITGLTVSITPTSASNKVLVIASVTACNDVGVTSGGLRLARDGTGIFAGDSAGNRILGQQVEPPAADRTLTLGFSFLDSPATTSATTYSVQAINSGAGTFYVNRSKTDTNTTSYFRSASSITVIEVLP